MPRRLASPRPFPIREKGGKRHGMVEGRHRFHDDNQRPVGEPAHGAEAGHGGEHQHFIRQGVHELAEIRHQIVLPSRFPDWALVIVMAREFAVSGLRLVAVDNGRVILRTPPGRRSCCR